MNDPDPSSRALPALALSPQVGNPGQSSFGGRTALLPTDASWPAHDGEPMMLLLQIDLAQARAAMPESADLLPTGGLLQVFMSEELAWETGPIESVPGIALRLHLADVSVVPCSGDGDPEVVVPMRFDPVRTFRGEDLSEDEEAYSLLSHQGHQLLGHPFEIQDDPLAMLPDGVGLILQVASDDQLGWTFGDLGMLYFMANLEAFAQGRLEEVHYAFQCY